MTTQQQMMMMMRLQSMMQQSDQNGINPFDGIDPTEIEKLQKLLEQRPDLPPETSKMLEQLKTNGLPDNMPAIPPDMAKSELMKSLMEQMKNMPPGTPPPSNGEQRQPPFPTPRGDGSDSTNGRRPGPNGETEPGLRDPNDKIKIRSRTDRRTDHNFDRNRNPSQNGNSETPKPSQAVDTDGDGVPESPIDSMDAMRQMMQEQARRNGMTLEEFSESLKPNGNKSPVPQTDEFTPSNGGERPRGMRRPNGSSLPNGTPSANGNGNRNRQPDPNGLPSDSFFPPTNSRPSPAEQQRMLRQLIDAMSKQPLPEGAGQMPSNNPESFLGQNGDRFAAIPTSTSNTGADTDSQNGNLETVNSNTAPKSPTELKSAWERILGQASNRTREPDPSTAPPGNDSTKSSNNSNGNSPSENNSGNDPSSSTTPSLSGNGLDSILSNAVRDTASGLQPGDIQPRSNGSARRNGSGASNSRLGDAFSSIRDFANSTNKMVRDMSGDADTGSSPSAQRPSPSSSLTSSDASGTGSFSQLGGALWSFFAAGGVVALILLAIHFLRMGIKSRSQSGPTLTQQQIQQIRARKDVVRAFHELARRTPEVEADWWPHHRAAVAMCSAKENRMDAIATLARVYEQARYLPDDVPLSSNDLDEARTALSQFRKN